MADGSSTSQWVEDEDLEYIKVGERVKGDSADGTVQGVANRVQKQLAERTQWIKDQLGNLLKGGLNVIGTLGSEAELDAIDTSTLKLGDSYFVEASLRIWNGTEWVNSGSLLGERGINLLGTWPDANALPDVMSNAVGDAYIWKGDLYLLVPKGSTGDESQREWASIGLKGANGESTFDIWKAQPGNENGTEAQFLASQQAKSNYDIWKAQDGNEGKTEAEYLETLKSTTPGEPGDPGPMGPARAAFEIKGVKAAEADLPTPGNAAEAYYIGTHLWVWVDDTEDSTQSKWEDLGDQAGKDAYQLWLAQGNSGDINAFFQTFKSTVPGPKGDNLNVKGTLATSTALNQLHDPVIQDAYAMADTGHLWVLTDSGWTDIGAFRGKSLYEVYQDTGGTEDEATWLASLKGTDGTNGTNVKIKGVVATVDLLPASAESDEVYAVQLTNSFYAYINGAWQSLGAFKGTDGENGTNGSSIDIVKILTDDDNTIPDAASNAGKTYVDLNGHLWYSIDGAWKDIGPAGAAGPQGIQGTGFNLRATVYSAGNLPTQNLEDGDAYLTSSDKMMYIRVEGNWAGPFDLVGPKGNDGEKGLKGDPGASVYIKGGYPDEASLRAAHPTGVEGDGYLIAGHLWTWYSVDGLVAADWHDVGQIQGPVGPTGKGTQGDPGKQGIKGDRGSVWITLPAGVDAPSAAFAGNTGDWAVSDSFKVYYKTLNNGWVYWGQLVAGDVNSPLASFGKAVRLGTTWVTLPIDEVPTINAGKLYVRSQKAGSDPVITEWTELVFPVNEVSDTAGYKYLRIKGGWVEVPLWVVDAPADGFNYARTRAVGADGRTAGTWVKLKDTPEELTTQDGTVFGRFWDSANSRYAWKLIVIPTSIQDLSTKDGKYYARVYETGGTTPIWKEIVTIGDVTTADGKYYARFLASGATVAIWKEVPAGITDLVTKDGKQYVRVYLAAGSAPIWQEFVMPTAFTRYDLNLVAATAELDLSAAQAFSIANSSARTLSFKAGTVPGATRTMTVVLIINGAGVITWPSTIVWSGSAQPTLGATTTVVTLLWDGIGNRWIGNVGATI